ncbi:hypothetical protein BHS09_34135 [Myxococcus xanthus]|uniref:PKD/Chitinase domain-containing protein n=1 Tax=Myxococcus xanthus TaxID=34 RepID=A0AAE6G6P2_MYXXA|nr:alpha/beta hydrolase-fold protein [Myxococcus xanthus]QDE71626.1 hypothetical protein BHS09_34135 [Myxococcus xanthus]QDE78907.1 hypothetical protein BHS08_34160 [Myxococcus xanthus]QDF08241.1 hypothetical protein BHS04_34270 [Myxococcus xanthus]
MHIHDRIRKTLFALAMLAGCGSPEAVDPSGDATATAPLLTSSKLTLTASMVQPDGVRPVAGPYQNLFDEQALIGDPRGGTGSAPVTTWGDAIFDDSAYPMGLIIDLGALYDITEIGVFDTFDSGSVSFAAGEPGAWTPVTNITLTRWQAWWVVPVTQRTRYLHLSRTRYAGMNEVVIYGAPVTGEPPANLPPTVSAGADQTVMLPTNAAPLTGTATDSDGTVVTRQWTQVSGPNTATLTGATTLSATASGLMQGLYEFELTVTDDDGATASDRMKVQVTPAPTGRGTTQEVYKSPSTPGGYGYVVYLPPGYDEGSNWPVVFFLHGMGEQGDGGVNQLKRVRAHGPQAYIDREGKDYPFILVSPQTSTSGFWSAYEAQYNLDPFFEHILATYKTDRKRVYLTGLSMGGAGTFNYASLFPSKLAAAIPICNGGYGSSAADALKMVQANLPIWGSHGLLDNDIFYTATAAWFTHLGTAMGGTGGVMSTYPSPARTGTAFFRPGSGQWEWIDGQTNTDTTGAEPVKPVLFTLFHDGNHYIWDRVYKEPKVFAWMLAQQRP